MSPSRGDIITIDGAAGLVFKGKWACASRNDRGFRHLMNGPMRCAGKVRTNADTPADAATARKFGAEGAGFAAPGICF
jgi:pyruvate,orthophosphate dikinase